MSSASGPQEPAPGEIEFWQSIKDSTDPHELRTYLSRFPAGFFHELASARLAKLDPRPVQSQATRQKEETDSKRPRSLGLLRLQLVYWAIAALVVGAVTVQAGGDEKINGWMRLTQPTIVYWANQRGAPDILTNEFYLPASLTTEQARERLIAEGKLGPSESLIREYFYTWNDFDAWPAMWRALGVALAGWGLGFAVVWIARGFLARSEG